MIRLLIERIRLPSLLSTAAKSKDAVTSTVKRNFAQIVKQPALTENLAKDIIVYRYENPKKYMFLNFFSISQFFFWCYIGQWSYSEMRNIKVKEDEFSEDTPWYKKINMGEQKYKNSLAAACFIIGYIIIFCGWTFTLRSVRYLILNKNGKTVSFVTYTPFGKNRIMDVPVKCISAQESRSTAKNFLPLKVQNRRLYYLLDMSGEFKNTKLFDGVIGLQRKFKE